MPYGALPACRLAKAATKSERNETPLPGYADLGHATALGGSA